jgi:uracil-DNA glycosylase family 4
MNKKQQLEKLKQKVEQDINLPFRDEATNLVFGEGSEDPKLLLLGEAPGRNEDLTGKPFIGSAGKILSELIESIGLTREEVYITSVLQYRPPKNRDPKPLEIQLFQPYLDEQIKLLNPKVIVTLGRFSLAKFLPTSKIADLHGKPQKVLWEGKEIVVIPMYHPAAIIYNQKLKQTLKEDFQVIKEYLSQG